MDIAAAARTFIDFYTQNRQNFRRTCRSRRTRGDPDEPAVHLVITHPQFHHPRGDKSLASTFASAATQGHPRERAADEFDLPNEA